MRWIGQEEKDDDEDGDGDDGATDFGDRDITKTGFLLPKKTSRRIKPISTHIS